MYSIKTLFSKAYSLNDFFGYDPMTVMSCFPDSQFLSVIIGVLLGNGTLYSVRNIAGLAKADHSKLGLKLDTAHDNIMGFIMSFFVVHMWLPSNKQLPDNLPTEVKHVEPITDKVYGVRTFYSIRSECFSQLRLWWYAKGRKRVPSNIGIYLNAISLAVWYMLSGRPFGKNQLGFLLTSPQYTDKCVRLLSGALKLTFGWETNISISFNDQKHKQYSLVFTESSSRLFAQEVGPYVLPSFQSDFEVFEVKVGQKAADLMATNASLIAKQQGSNSKTHAK